MSFFPAFSYQIAQNTQALTSPSEVEALMKQVELLREANNQLTQSQLQFFKDATTQLTGSFSNFVSTIDLGFALISLLIVISGAILTYFNIDSFKKAQNTIKAVQQEIEGLVRQEFNRSIAQSIERRLEAVERVIEKEEVISSTRVDYLLPHEPAKNSVPDEYKLLENRGFQEIRFREEIQKRDRRLYEVLVLDFVNDFFTDESIIEIIKQVADNLAPTSALVIYINRRLSELDDILKAKKVYFTPANNAVTLMGRVVDAAQMAYALRQGPNP